MFFALLNFLYYFYLSSWLILLVINILSEIASKELLTINFAIGALLTFVFGILFATPLEQIYIFLISSFCFYIITRPFARMLSNKRIFKSQIIYLIGKEGIVTSSIFPNNTGTVLINNINWCAITLGSEPLYEKERIVISDYKGLKLIAKRILEKSNHE